ncbi:putative ATP synthase subunit f, mitochondrial [Ylistrum balloti]|uniref:putative ATP synthase subunit f, mitochondrial n=1 Tax=Ylistrum balloti TaxID=509963 RepID=UPI002905E3C7|nr:putative ATP synthase subunit f, mitochondrial [Ylistrum balloti]
MEGLGNGIRNIGKYDPNYNPRVHGTYDPSRWYGKPDKPFMDVTVKELPAWISRRDISPFGIARAFGRGYATFKNNFFSSKNSNWKVFMIMCIPVAILEAQHHFHTVFDKRKYD